MPSDIPGIAGFERISSATPDSLRVAQVRQALMNMAEPVRPMPSNAVMTAIASGVFVVLALVLTIPFGFYGIAKMSGAERWVEYPVLALLACVLAGSNVTQMIPGSRRILSATASAAIAVLLLSITALLLFPDLSTNGFAHRGIPCLRLGVLCALPAGGVIWAMMRHGFVTDPTSAAISGGALAGLLGFGVLALHCPIFTATHILAWHVGVIVATSCVGAIAGLSLSRLR